MSAKSIDSSTEMEPIQDYIVVETKTKEAENCYENCEVDINTYNVLQLTPTQAYYLGANFERKQTFKLLRVIPPTSIDVAKLVAEEMEYRASERKKAEAAMARTEKEKLAKQLAAAEKKAAKLREMVKKTQ